MQERRATGPRLHATYEIASRAADLTNVCLSLQDERQERYSLLAKEYQGLSVASETPHSQ